MNSARIRHFSASFNGRPALRDICLDTPPTGITVLAGRSGSGKTTLLRALNRLNEIFPGYAGSGCIQLNFGRGLEDIYTGCGAPAVRPASEIRRLAGMVFQTPDVLPGSILENLCLPLRHVAGLDRKTARQKAEEALVATSLWPEVRDRLRAQAASLSGGQQQRLCLARALALDPAILLLDEPTASLDAASTEAIENLLLRLARNKPLIMVSHHPAQAIRLASRLALVAKGKIGAVFDPPLPTPAALAEMLGNS